MGTAFGCSGSAKIEFGRRIDWLASLPPFAVVEGNVVPHSGHPKASEGW